MHVEALAVDDRVGALAVQHHAERVGGVAVRARDLARQDHLIGADHGADGGVAVAVDGVEQDQVAALGELGIDQAPGGIEGGAAFRPTPVHRPVILARRIPQRRLVLGPAGLDVACVEIAIEVFERRAVLEVIEYRRHDRPPVVAPRTGFILWTNRAISKVMMRIEAHG